MKEKKHRKTCFILNLPLIIYMNHFDVNVSSIEVFHVKRYSIIINMQCFWKLFTFSFQIMIWNLRLMTCLLSQPNDDSIQFILSSLWVRVRLSLDAFERKFALLLEHILLSLKLIFIPFVFFLFFSIYFFDAQKHRNKHDWHITMEKIFKMKKLFLDAIILLL